MYLREILFVMLALAAVCQAMRQRLDGLWGIAFALLLAYGVGETMEQLLLAGGIVYREAVLMAALFPVLLFWWLQDFIRNSLSGTSCLSRVCLPVWMILAGCGVSVCIALFCRWQACGEKGLLPGGLAAFVLCCCMCVVAFAACVVFRKLSVSVEEKRRLEKLIREEEYRTRQRQEIMTASAEVRKLRHDMKNSFQLLYGLLENGSVDEAMNYIQWETRQLPDIPAAVYTSSEAVNTLLNLKMAQAKEKDILFTIKVTTDLAGIQDYDVCQLLGNLLDNAIEASVQCEKEQRRADLKLYGDRHKCLIEASNTTAGNVLENGRLPATAKKDSQNHGFGQISVADIVERYNGSMNFSEKEGQLYISVILFRRF